MMRMERHFGLPTHQGIQELISSYKTMVTS
jgi:hypothetical protein